jgi:hypothetical protein
LPKSRSPEKIAGRENPQSGRIRATTDLKRLAPVPRSEAILVISMTGATACWAFSSFAAP